MGLVGITVDAGRKAPRAVPPVFAGVLEVELLLKSVEMGCPKGRSVGRWILFEGVGLEMGAEVSGRVESKEGVSVDKSVESKSNSRCFGLDRFGLSDGESRLI